MFRRIPIVATLICVVTVPICAVDLSIANAGFEQVVLPCAPGPNCFSSFSVAGWIGNGQFSTFKPSTGSGGVFPGGIPEGANVAALGADAGNAVLVQTLNATLQPDSTYTLVFSVGTRADVALTGYSVELLAGSTVLASDSALAPPSGTFLTGRIVYASTNANPALLGQAVGIRLTGNGRGQADFDKISLDATPATFSSSASQIASGGGWKTTLAIVNLSATRNSIGTVFRGDDGRLLTLPFVVTQQGVSQAATASSVDRTIDPGATLLIESEAPASTMTVVGWAELVSSGPVSGYAIFRQRTQDGRDAEGTAPLESRHLR